MRQHPGRPCQSICPASRYRCHKSHGHIPNISAFSCSFLSIFHSNAPFLPVGLSLGPIKCHVRSRPTADADRALIPLLLNYEDVNKSAPTCTFSSHSCLFVSLIINYLFCKTCKKCSVTVLYSNNLSLSSIRLKVYAYGDYIGNKVNRSKNYFLVACSISN